MKVTHAGRQITVNVTADGDGLVSHAGSALLAEVADKMGLTRALSFAVGEPPPARDCSIRNPKTVSRSPLYAAFRPARSPPARAVRIPAREAAPRCTPPSRAPGSLAPDAGVAR